MKNRHYFSEVVEASVIGSHCVYVKVLVDIPSLFFTYLTANFTKLSATHVTSIGASLAIVSAYFIYNNNVYIAALFFYFSFVCDFIDGRIARLNKTASVFGKKLDLVFDRLVLATLSFSYLIHFDLYDMHAEQLLLLVFFVLFLTYDSLESSNEQIKYKRLMVDPNSNSEIIRSYNKAESEPYFFAFKTYKRWIPSRVFCLVLVFFLAPLLNFKFFLTIALLSMLIRFLLLLTNYFKVNI